MTEYQIIQENYFKSQKEFFEYTFRVEDNKRQALKGQPSLDGEDTGTQWKNDS